MDDGSGDNGLGDDVSGVDGGRGVLGAGQDDAIGMVGGEAGDFFGGFDCNATEVLDEFVIQIAEEINAGRGGRRQDLVGDHGVGKVASADFAFDVGGVGKTSDELDRRSGRVAEFGTDGDGAAAGDDAGGRGEGASEVVPGLLAGTTGDGDDDEFGGSIEGDVPGGSKTVGSLFGDGGELADKDFENAFTGGRNDLDGVLHAEQPGDLFDFATMPGGGGGRGGRGGRVTDGWRAGERGGGAEAGLRFGVGKRGVQPRGDAVVSDGMVVAAATDRNDDVGVGEVSAEIDGSGIVVGGEVAEAVFVRRVVQDEGDFFRVGSGQLGTQTVGKIGGGEIGGVRIRRGRVVEEDFHVGGTDTCGGKDLQHSGEQGRKLGNVGLDGDGDAVAGYDGAGERRQAERTREGNVRGGDDVGERRTVGKLTKRGGRLIGGVKMDGGVSAVAKFSGHAMGVGKRKGRRMIATTVWNDMSDCERGSRSRGLRRIRVPE